MTIGRPAADSSVPVTFQVDGKSLIELVINESLY